MYFPVNPGLPPFHSIKRQNYNTTPCSSSTNHSKWRIIQSWRKNFIWWPCCLGLWPKRLKLRWLHEGSIYYSKRKYTNFFFTNTNISVSNYGYQYCCNDRVKLSKQQNQFWYGQKCNHLKLYSVKLSNTPNT